MTLWCSSSRARRQEVWVTLHSWTSMCITTLIASAGTAEKNWQLWMAPSPFQRFGGKPEKFAAGPQYRHGSDGAAVTRSLCACSLLLIGRETSHPLQYSLLIGLKSPVVFAPGKKSRSLYPGYLINNIKPGEVAGEGKCFQLGNRTENSCGAESACWLQQLFSKQDCRDKSTD